MSNRVKLGTTAVLVVAALALTGCSTIADPDKVGLYYLEGSSDGYKFDKCIAPGTTGPSEGNNSVVYLPTSLRTWNILERGGDSDQAIVVASLPQKDQPSGVQVKVWSQTTFYLNTFCDEDGGVVKAFWEKIGRSKSADTDDGWRKMLETYLVPPLVKAEQDVIRKYDADQLVGNVEGVRAKAQAEVSAAFTAELKRLTGGDFFCGPTFNRASEECPAIEMIIVDVDLNNQELQDARNQKVREMELAAAALEKAKGEAAALMAEATGKKNAAAELAKLYANPNWVRLQDTILKTQALIEACKAAKECKLIVGADGNLIMS